MHIRTCITTPFGIARGVEHFELTMRVISAKQVVPMCHAHLWKTTLELLHIHAARLCSLSRPRKHSQTTHFASCVGVMPHHRRGRLGNVLHPSNLRRGMLRRLGELLALVPGRTLGNELYGIVELDVFVMLRYEIPLLSG